MTRARTAVAGLLVACAGGAAALDGRWEGRVELPGMAVPVLLDLTPAGALLTLPGRGVQGMRLPTFEQRDGVLRLAALPVAEGAEADAMQLVLRESGGRLVGEFRQGGHAAALALQRTGDAPAPAAAALPLPAAAVGTWRGRYDLGFGAREATLRLAPGAASMTIVGRRTVEIAFDEAGQRGALLMLRAGAADLAVEAPAAGAVRGVLEATLRQGPFEAVFELRRGAAP